MQSGHIPWLNSTSECSEIYASTWFQNPLSSPDLLARHADREKPAQRLHLLLEVKRISLHFFEKGISSQAIAELALQGQIERTVRTRNPADDEAEVNHRNDTAA